MSLSDLAAAVHYDRSYLSRLERGLRSPAPSIARLCDAAVKANGALLRLATSTPTLPGPAPALPSPSHGSDLSGLFLSAAERVEIFTDDLNSILVGAHRMFTLLRAEGHANPPAVLLPSLATQFGILRAASRQARDPIRKRIIGLAAYYVEYAGWMVQECGDDRGSMALTSLSAELAGLAEEPSLAAFALIRLADVALYRGDGAEVVALAERVPDSAPAPLRTLSYQRAAQGRALLGQPRECRDALARAQAEDATDAGNGYFPLGSSGGGRSMNVVRGWCLLDLGRPAEAAAALDAGLSAAPREAHRARSLYGVRLALSHAADGDRVEARRAGLAALDEARQVDSASVRHQLRALASTVRRWRADDETQHLRIEIDRALAIARPR